MEDELGAPPAKRAAKSSDPPVKRMCTFKVPQKNRTCRLLAMKGQDFCPEHATNEGLSPDSPYFRVECPYNPKHTVFAKLLKQHMQKCNDRPLPPEPYFKQDLNTGTGDSDGSQVIGKSLIELSPEELSNLIQKITEVMKDVIPATSDKAGSFQLAEIEEQLSDPKSGKNSKRHIQQNSALLHLLNNEELLMDSTCFVEFGSGRGGLSYWLGQALGAKTQSTKSCSLLLVDRNSHRHKRENKLEEEKFNIERVRIDIKDLKLDEFQCVRDAKNLVGVCKHLCGDGTDMALRCLMETNSTATTNLAGIVMATCCHHRCTWRTYVGTKYLKDWGFEEKHFKPLTCLTSWAVCGTGRSRFLIPNEHEQPSDSISTPLDNLGNLLRMSSSVRRKIGYDAKRIIDHARCRFVEEYSLKACLTNFVKSEDTYENIAIVGSRKNWISDIS